MLGGRKGAHRRRRAQTIEIAQQIFCIRASPARNIFLTKCLGILYTLDMATKAMTQTQIVKAMAEACEIPNAKARQVLTFLSDTAVKEVKKNGLFVVPGLGRLVRVDRKARMGRNPATGEAIKIAAKKVVKFRIAKSAKDAIVPPKVKK
jgi:DNA-binding protein HU-beta